jgi:hypothetical protein
LLVKPTPRNVNLGNGRFAMFNKERDISLYARNLFSFIETMIDKPNKALAVNWDDELVKATALTKDGAVIHPNFQPK